MFISLRKHNEIVAQLREENAAAWRRAYTWRDALVGTNKGVRRIKNKHAVTASPRAMILQLAKRVQGYRDLATKAGYTSVEEALASITSKGEPQCVNNSTPSAAVSS